MLRTRPRLGRTFGSSPDILVRHPLDHGNRFGGDSRTTATRAGLEFPEEAKTLPMATQQGIEFTEEQDVLPTVDAAGEQDQPEVIRWRRAGFFDITVQDHQLLAEEGVFPDEVDSTSSQVCRGREKE